MSIKKRLDVMEEDLHANRLTPATVAAACGEVIAEVRRAASHLSSPATLETALLQLGQLQTAIAALENQPSAVPRAAVPSPADRTLEDMPGQAALPEADAADVARRDFEDGAAREGQAAEAHLTRKAAPGAELLTESPAERAPAPGEPAGVSVPHEPTATDPAHETQVPSRKHSRKEDS